VAKRGRPKGGRLRMKEVKISKQWCKEGGRMELRWCMNYVILHAMEFPNMFATSKEDDVI